MSGYCNERRSEFGDKLAKASWAFLNISQLETDGRVQMNVDIMESHRNGPQLSTHDDDDDMCHQSHHTQNGISISALLY